MCIYASPRIKPVIAERNENYVAVRVTVGNQQFLIINSYLKPKNSVGDLNKTEDLLRQHHKALARLTRRNEDWIWVGDFNTNA